MATNQPYSLQDIQDRINTLVNNDSDTPDTTDDEWTNVLNLINQSIGKWESSDTLWDELYTSFTGSTIVAGTTTYALTSLDDMRFPAGPVILRLNGVDNKVQVISPEESQREFSNKVVWFTGNNRDGWTLNLSWTPTAGDGTVGATFIIPYYKYATRFDSSSTTDELVEMSDPNFIVYDVSATKALLESQNNKFSVFNSEALNIMDRMKVMNEIKPAYNDNGVEDIDAISFGAVFGE